MNNFKDFWKIGNILVSSNGTRYFIVNDEVAVSLTSCVEKDGYDSNGHSSNSCGNCVRVVKHNTYSYGLGFNYNLTAKAEQYETILWTNEIKEMTVSEIEEALNMQSGTLRIKK